MTITNYVFYRCVNRITQTWFRIGIEFSHNNPYNRVGRITKEGSLHATSFVPFQSALTIYKMTKEGFCRMEAIVHDVNDSPCLFLRETQEFLSSSQFHIRHRRERFNALFRPTMIMHEKGGFTPARKSTMTDLGRRRKFEKRPKKEYWDPSEHAFMTIEGSRGKDREDTELGVSLDGLTEHISTTKLLYNTSYEELTQYDASRQISSSTREGSPQRSPRSVLRNSASPSKGLSVHFEGYSAPYSAPVHLTSFVSAVPCKRNGRGGMPSSPPLSTWTLWLKACVVPLGKWGLAVLLLGFVGGTFATPGTVVFYAAAAMTITGAAAVGISLFRVHRNASLQQQRRDEVNQCWGAAPCTCSRRYCRNYTIIL